MLSIPARRPWLHRTSLCLYIIRTQPSRPQSMVSASPPNKVFRNARLATLAPGASGLGVVEDGAVAIQGERIAYVGPAAELPAALIETSEIVDCHGRWITPGLIDCHTHLVFG